MLGSSSSWHVAWLLSRAIVYCCSSWFNHAYYNILSSPQAFIVDPFLSVSINFEKWRQCRRVGVLPVQSFSVVTENSGFFLEESQLGIHNVLLVDDLLMRNLERAFLRFLIWICVMVAQLAIASLAGIDSLTIDHIEYHCISDAIYADGSLVETCG